MIQVDPSVVADRAAALLLIDRLRDEEARIHSEIERLRKLLDDLTAQGDPRGGNPQEHDGDDARR